jgi:DNA gyrase subunit B/topoisomerase-4 subunit B
MLTRPNAKFFDSLQHAPLVPAELFIVEGDSAAQAVCAVRNPALQAVLPLPGKPMNAMRASPGRLASSPWLMTLTVVLGSAPGTALPLGELRYRRVLLLSDPDADGIHISALLQIFFYHCMRPLLEARQIEIIHAPWGEIRRPGATPLLSFHAAQFAQQSRELSGADAGRVQRVRYRGLGTITPAILERECINPATRKSHVLSVADAELAVKVFAGTNI